MLSSISWSQLLTTLAWLLPFYYVFIAAFYYRTEIAGLFKAKAVKQPAFEGDADLLEGEKRDTAGGPLPYNKMTAAVGKENPQTRGKIHDLMEDLKNLLVTAVRAKTVREELIMALQMLLRSYTDLKNLPITDEINQHIAAECQHICSITLSDAEMTMLWNG